MSPESLSKSKYSFKSDVWSFGVTCYEIISRKVPYSPLSNTAVVAAVFTTDKSPLVSDLERYQNLPAALPTLLSRCLNKDPDQRPDFAQIVPELEAIPFLAK